MNGWSAGTNSEDNTASALSAPLDIFQMNTKKTLNELLHILEVYTLNELLCIFRVYLHHFCYSCHMLQKK